MAAWIPVLKTVLPYVTNIVTTAIPVFTARRDADKAAVVAQQIEELQQAVRGNAESLRVLAEQLARTVEALESGARASEAALWRTRRVARVAALAAGVALALALYALIR